MQIGAQQFSPEIMGFTTAEKTGTEYMLVEQDDCYKKNPFDCLRRNYEFLKSRGFE